MSQAQFFFTYAPVVVVAAGSGLYTFGDNGAGQLGIGSVADQSLPVQVGLLTTWKNISGSRTSSYGIQTNGTLWGWGLNAYYGAAGLGNLSNQSSPVQVGLATTWNTVSGSKDWFWALGTQINGTLWGWGINSSGQLGDGTTVSKSTPIQVGSSTTWSIASTGYGHALGVTTSGALFSWGYNNDGQLGSGTTTSRSTPVQVGSLTTWGNTTGKISAGYYHNLAIKTDGTLWVWGLNASGQLGNGNNTNMSSPVQVGLLTTWSSASAGGYFSMAIDTSGKLWSWGANSDGQLGQGNTTPLSSPVQVGLLTTWKSVYCGLLHVVATQTNNTMWTWGYNYHGQVGDKTTTNRSSPVQVGTLTTWTTASAGGYHTLAINTINTSPTGTLWGWGANAYGQVGNGSTTSVSSVTQVGLLSTWHQVSGGGSHTMALKTDGTLWGYGFNTDGELGIGTSGASTHASTPVQIGSSITWSSISAGANHTVAIDINGNLWNWGYFKAMGNGTPLTNKSTPVQVGSLTNWKMVAGGDQFTLAIKNDGTLWGWGDDTYGQLGDGNHTVSYSSPIQIGSATNWASVFCSMLIQTSAAIDTSGKLWAWGYNSYKQVGDGTNVHKSTPVQIGSATTWASVSIGGTHTLATRTDGTLWAWGTGTHGELGAGSVALYSTPVQVGSATTWSSVAAGFNSSVAVQTTGTLWSWGANSYGQLGDGNTTSLSTPTQVGSSTGWVSVSGGSKQVVALHT